MTDINPPDDDPFAEFDDWLVDGPTGCWSQGEPNQLYMERAAELAERNALTLLGREWSSKVKRFRAALESIPDQHHRSQTLNQHVIHFYGFDFNDFGSHFDNLEFPCSVSFHSCRFNRFSTSFRSCRFEGSFASFEEVDFNNRAVDFSGAQFLVDYVHFDEAKFGSGSVSFHDCDFVDAFCSFDNARFSRWGPSFVRSTFGRGGTSFSGVEVENGRVDLSGVRARGDVDFVEPRSLDILLSMRDSVFERSLTIDGEYLGSSCDFRGLSVAGTVNIGGAVFGLIPDFRGARFDRPTEVAGVVVPKPQMFRSKPYGIQKAYHPEDVLKLRKLKAMAIAANDHEKDGEFFAYEMMAKRGVEHTTFWQLLSNTIYWKVSFYGQSYLLPLGWLAGSFATFAAIYSLMAALPIGGWQSLAFGLTYSFKNSLPFLGTLTRSVPSPEEHISWFAVQLQAIKDAQPGPDWFTVLGTAQAMLSLFFFFFLLLGLRNKFRLK